jgi:tetratricopeptide (TPR) repeat protein
LINPAALIELAESRPDRAIEAANQVLTDADADGRDRAHALRAVGLARITIGEAAEAVVALEKAIDIAETVGDDEFLGEVKLTMAAALTVAGRAADALSMLDSADQLLSHHGRARAAVQRAGVLARRGDFAAALPLYDHAEPILRRGGDSRWLALLSSNRGLVYTYLGRLGEAARDLESARALYEQLGRESSTAEMVHNLGFLAMRMGDIPTSLARLDEAEERFRTLGLNVGVVLLDRAEALLLAGLTGEAGELARAAAERFALDGLDVERGEALLVDARSSLAGRQHELAAESSRRARELFAQQGRPGWELRAHYFEVAAAVEGAELVERDDLTRLAEDLKATGQRLAAFHVRLLAGRVALQLGDAVSAEADLVAAGDVPSYAPVDLRVQAWLARALLAQSRGEGRAVLRAIRNGVGLLDSYRATLGSTESRVNVAGHASELFELALAAALDSGRPSSVLRWLERARAGSLLAVPPAPPEDQGLAEALSALRVAQAKVRDAELAGQFSSELWREQSRLERQVRRSALRIPGSGQARAAVPALKVLQGMLGNRLLLVVAEIRGEVVVVRVDRRSARMIPAGPVERIRDAAARLQRAYRSLGRRLSESTSAIHQTALASAASDLDAVLLEPVGLDESSLILIPPPAMHSLPWWALPTITHRTLVISPSVLAWYRAETKPERPGHVLLVAGPDLEQAHAEVDELAVKHPDACILKGSDASVDNVLSNIAGARLAHLACHATFRADNAMFSSLRLADGELTVYDLEQSRSVPDVVVMSACDSGLSQESAGEELTGLATSLLGMGARSLVASNALVPDDEATRVLMGALHDQMLAGATAAEALAAARTQLVDGPHAQSVSRDAFYCLGS